MVRDIRPVGVVGLGTMGAGIAEVFARHGYAVIGVERDDNALALGRGHLDRSTGRAVQRDRLSAADQAALLGRITFTTDLTELAPCDLVVEAVPERLELKRELFDRLDRILPADAVLATNTSSLSVTEIAAATRHPDRVVGMHFFNPAPVLKLVEVVRTTLTAAGVVDAVVDLARELGKTPVVCGDQAGFIANALLFGYLNQAASMVDSGYAGAADIDAAMQSEYGYPMGPLALLDLIGLDTSIEILRRMHQETGRTRHEPAPILMRLVAADRLGRKSGHGFYVYGGEDEPAATPAEERKSAREIADTLVQPYLADAVRMQTAGYASAADIDRAMTLGCGLPKGPFELLDEAEARTEATGDQ
jgi:3-hydroxybutyryl-CoA dehydrogenase